MNLGLLLPVACSSNPGNTTSPAGDNTFEILLPPGLTPTGPITPGLGSPPGAPPKVNFEMTGC